MKALDGLIRLHRWKLDEKTAPKGHKELEIYTTRADTLYGGTGLDFMDGAGGGDVLEGHSAGLRLHR